MEKKKRGRPKKVDMTGPPVSSQLQDKIALKTWKMSTAKSNEGCCCAVIIWGASTYVKKAQASMFSDWIKVLEYYVQDPKGKKDHYAVHLKTCFDDTKQWRAWLKDTKKKGWNIEEID